MVTPTERHISRFYVSYVDNIFIILLTTFLCNLLKAFICMCTLDYQPNADYKISFINYQHE